MKRWKRNWICHESHFADPPINCFFGLLVYIFAGHATVGTCFALLPGQVAFRFSLPAIAHHRLQVEAVYRRCDGKRCCHCVLSSVDSKHSQWLEPILSFRVTPYQLALCLPSCLLHSSLAVPQSFWVLKSFFWMRIQIDLVEHTQPQGCVWFVQFAGCLSRKTHYFPWSIRLFI